MVDPVVSVIVPAYNAEAFVLEAVGSILRQTFRDFELVVIDDGSQDDTAKLISEISDPRVRLIRMDTNCGLAGARNAGVRHSSGEFIAWLDADDVSAPSRLARQVRLMNGDPRLGACGSWLRTMGDGPATTWRMPRGWDSVAARMLFDDPLGTSSVMVRRAALPNDQPFRQEFAPAEDYDLWERLSREWRMVNLPRILTRYRRHGSQTSTRDQAAQRKSVRLIQERQLARLGLGPNDEQWRLHRLVGLDWGRGATQSDIQPALEWLSLVVTRNDASGVFPRHALRDVAAQRVTLLKHRVNPSLRTLLLSKYQVWRQ